MSDYARPGCFGSPLCHDPRTPPCTLCRFRIECAPAAAVVARDLRQRFGIEAIIKGARKQPKRVPIRVAAAATPMPPPVSADPALPVKARELLESLARAGVDLAGSVRAGRNPFLTRPPAFMRTLVGALLGGGFTRKEARDLLVSSHGWSEATASSHAGFATAALIACGAAREVEGRIVGSGE